MTFKYYKYFEKDAIADGLTYEDSWEADEDLKLKRIHIARKDGIALTKSTFYLKIAERIFTHPVVPASILAPDALISPTLDVSFRKGEKLFFTFKNLEGASVSIMITFEAHAP